MISSRSNVQSTIEAKMPKTARTSERFNQSDLAALRGELLQSSLDSWQAGDVIITFLTGRGYGVSSGAARSAAVRIEQAGFMLDALQNELENLALVM